ncbi:hypothetical protein M2283_006726 [Streptomyces pseudovenezuelae]|uniref:Uncharacterized protein n=1 Tax=Streptomyces pseudovenezuelae TaxID=67350 RepID=A0ABT6LSV0_9ACTN|nr:hypothetical protein [Streptomyces pseudovenezuelae]
MDAPAGLTSGGRRAELTKKPVPVQGRASPWHGGLPGTVRALGLTHTTQDPVRYDTAEARWVSDVDEATPR